jgi:DNA-binding GntR family transcriptional regulator
VEEFVTISPRRGVAVRSLNLRDIQEIYQLVGALESSALLMVAPTITAEDIAYLRSLDVKAQQAIEKDDLDAFYANNYGFHDFFLDRMGNSRISALVHSKKQQLYDWNRKFDQLHVNWENSGVFEHEEVIRLLESGAIQEAAAYLRDVHWGFNVQEPFVNQVYFSEQG